MEEGDVLVSFSGWMRQKMSTFRFDKRWFCVLNDKGFDLFSDEESEKPDVHYSPDMLTNIRSISSYSAPGLQLRFREGLPLTLLCKSITEVQRWLCAFGSKPTAVNLSINDFELLKVIGRGSCGKVFLAKMIKTDELFAIKVIRKDRLTESQKESRVLAERNILMRAEHPFLTRLYFAFQNTTKLYFVMEYVSGGDLRFHLDKGVEFTLPQIKIFIAELVVALRALHKLGIIYRDLKPENILIDLNGHLKLADFGLSRQIDPRDEEGPTSLCGTYEYIAPEMLREEVQTVTLDWWGLGIVTFLLVCGYLPYHSSNRTRLFDSILNASPRIPHNVDPVTASFIRGLLEKNPASRLGGFGTDICAHEFFKGIDWKMVENQEYETNFMPYIESEESVNNFDEAFTREPPTDSYVDPSEISLTIQDFSYQAFDIIV